MRLEQCPSICTDQHMRVQHHRVTIYDSRYLQADCQEPGSARTAPEPYAR